MIARLYSISDLLKLTQQARGTVYSRISLGLLPGPTVQYGRRKYYDEASKEAFLTAYRNGPFYRDTEKKEIEL